MAHRPSVDDYLLPYDSWRFQFVWPDGNDPDGNPLTFQGEIPGEEVHPMGPTPNLETWFDETLFKDIESQEGSPGDKVFDDKWFNVIHLALSGRTQYMLIEVKNRFKELFKGKILPRGAIGINFIVTYNFNTPRYPELEGCSLEVACPVVGNHKGTFSVYKTVRLK